MNPEPSYIPEPRSRLPRRDAIKWMLATAAAAALPGTDLFGARMEAKNIIGKVTGKGYGTDPDLVKIYKPGDLWPLSFTPAQLKTAEALSDVILPKDQYGPAASSLGIPDMIDEWISSPYPQQAPDRPVILQGLDWLEAESQKRFEKDFASLSDEQKHSICDDIHYGPEAKSEFKKGASFFSRFRNLCAGAYFATPDGWKAIGYVGNVPMAKFDGPPQEVLEKLGIEQTVV